MKKTTILCVMALLWPFAKKDNRTESLEMRSAKPNLNLLLLLALIGLSNLTHAQAPSDLKALRVGDKLPTEFWERKHQFYENGEAFEQALAPFKGKLLVLDFWASWCGSCINKFRTIEQLQAEYKGEANFLLVNTKNTRDSLAQVEALLSGRKYNSAPYQLSSVFNDSYIHQLFPYGYLPYYVIVSPNAEVRAILPAELINAANVRLMIDNYSQKTKKGGSHE